MASCKECTHYEAYHHYPNPNAVATHFCKKCNEEIKTYHGRTYIPKACYLNDYFEESKEAKKARLAKEYYMNFYQIED